MKSKRTSGKNISCPGCARLYSVVAKDQSLPSTTFCHHNMLGVHTVTLIQRSECTGKKRYLARIGYTTALMSIKITLSLFSFTV